MRERELEKCCNGVKRRRVRQGRKRRMNGLVGRRSECEGKNGSWMELESYRCRHVILKEELVSGEGSSRSTKLGSTVALLRPDFPEPLLHINRTSYRARVECGAGDRALAYATYMHDKSSMCNAVVKHINHVRARRRSIDAQAGGLKTLVGSSTIASQLTCETHHHEVMPSCRH